MPVAEELEFGVTAVIVEVVVELASEFIATRTIKEWKRVSPDLSNKPAVFLLHG